MHRRALFLLPAALFLHACFGFGSLLEEDRDSALMAVSEAFESGQAESETATIIEITTDFTIGEAIADTLEELRAFFESQIPCSTVTVDGPNATITVDFGDLSDSCEYRGVTYAGVIALTVERNETDGVQLLYSFTEFGTGDLSVNGTATVDWTAADGGSRHVVHSLTWENSRGGTIAANGDRTWTLIDPAMGLDGGIELNGERDWTSDRGLWSLAMDQVQFRLTDPLPFSGSYTMSTTRGNTVEMSFAEQGGGTIRVTLSAGENEWIFDVSPVGEVDEVTDAAE